MEAGLESGSEWWACWTSGGDGTRGSRSWRVTSSVAHVAKCYASINGYISMEEIDMGLG